MALSQPQLNECCYLEAVPMSSDHIIISEDGLYITEKSVSDSNSAYQRLLTRINDLSDDQETELAALLDRHIALKTDFLRIEGGSLGNSMNGISFNPQEERNDIAARIRFILGAYKESASMSGAGAGGDSSIPFIR